MNELISCASSLGSQCIRDCFHVLVGVFCSGFHVDSAVAAETALIVTIVSTASMESISPRLGNAYATTANVYILYEG